MKKSLFLLLPVLGFGQISIHPISSYTDTTACDSCVFLIQQKPNSPVVYKKTYANQLRAWIGTGFDSTSCATTIDCDSTGTLALVRKNSPTLSGTVTNTGRDTTTGRGAWHGSIKTDSLIQTKILSGDSCAVPYLDSTGFLRRGTPRSCP